MQQNFLKLEGYNNIILYNNIIGIFHYTAVSTAAKQLVFDTPEKRIELEKAFEKIVQPIFLVCPIGTQSSQTNNVMYKIIF